MVATVARIGFIQNQYRLATATTGSVATKYGNLARQTEEPVETFFDSVSDAETVAAARQTLLSGDRRRFRVQAIGLDEVLALNYVGAIPVGRYTDTDRGADSAVLVSELIIDFNKQAAALAVWG